ncbi:RICIN domain-containing protein [Streptomyces sp. NPDC054961]
MPRSSPRTLRARRPDGTTGALSTLLVTACPGPPVCAAVHTYLFVDGLDLVARSDGAMAGLDPSRLLRPGGPLYPADAPREAVLAAPRGPDPGPNTSLGVVPQVGNSVGIVADHSGMVLDVAGASQNHAAPVVQAAPPGGEPSLNEQWQFRPPVG